MMRNLSTCSIGIFSISFKSSIHFGPKQYHPNIGAKKGTKCKYFPSRLTPIGIRIDAVYRGRHRTTCAGEFLLIFWRFGVEKISNVRSRIFPHSRIFQCVIIIIIINIIDPVDMVHWIEQLIQSHKHNRFNTFIYVQYIYSSQCRNNQLQDASTNPCSGLQFTCPSRMENSYQFNNNSLYKAIQHVKPGTCCSTRPTIVRH